MPLYLSIIFYVKQIEHDLYRKFSLPFFDYLNLTMERTNHINDYS